MHIVAERGGKGWGKAGWHNITADSLVWSELSGYRVCRFFAFMEKGTSVVRLSGLFNLHRILACRIVHASVEQSVRPFPQSHKTTAGFTPLRISQNIQIPCEEGACWIICAANQWFLVFRRKSLHQLSSFALRTWHWNSFTVIHGYGHSVRIVVKFPLELGRLRGVCDKAEIG